MVQEIRSLQKLAIFFRVSRWGRRGGGGGGGLYAVLYGTCLFYMNISYGPMLAMLLGPSVREAKTITVYAMGPFSKEVCL